MCTHEKCRIDMGDDIRPMLDSGDVEIKKALALRQEQHSQAQQKVMNAIQSVREHQSYRRNEAEYSSQVVTAHAHYQHNARCVVFI